MAWDWANDLADSWDEDRRYNERVLDRFVRDHPNWLGIGVCGVGNAWMELSAGFVDVLRLGNGIGENLDKGGSSLAWGVGRDGLRALGLAGPLGRGAKFFYTAANAKSANAIANQAGKVCGWIATTKALNQLGFRYGGMQALKVFRVGGKMFRSVTDLVSAVGKTASAMGKTSIQSRIHMLRSMGARVHAVVPVKALEDVAKRLPFDGSIALISLRCFKSGKDVGGHAVYAFRDLFGRVRLMDRYGTYDSLESLANRYGSVLDRFGLTAMARVENVMAKFVGPLQKAAVLSMEINAAIIDEGTADEIQRAHEQSAKGVPNNSRFHRMKPGQTLAEVAQIYYGDSNKWPVLYAGSRLQIGDDPDKLRPGQTLWIPELQKP